MTGDIKHIVIIESLKKDDRLTGKELYDDLILRKIEYEGKAITSKFYSIDNKNSLIDILKYYQIHSQYLTGGLLIHLEMHGASNKTGLSLTNAELISWTEIVDLFRPINISTVNKLFVTMATCFGRYLFQGIDPYKKSPYSGYLSASEEIYPDEIIDNFGVLFEKLIESGNIVNAYLEMQKTSSSFYYKDSERAFEDAFEMTKNDSDFDELLKKEMRTLASEMNTPVTDEIIVELRDMALLDIYHKQKAAFHFK